MSRQARGERGKDFTADQRVFRHAVEMLDQRSGAVAAAGVMLKLGAPLGQLQSLRLHGLEVGVRVGEDHLFALFAVLLIFVDGGDILDGRPAAVVAHAVKAHDGKARALLLGQRRGDVLLHGAIARAVAVDDAEGGHVGAVRREPPKQRPGQLRILEGIRTLKDVVFNAAALQQRGQHGRMAEWPKESTL